MIKSIISIFFFLIVTQCYLVGHALGNDAAGDSNDILLKIENLYNSFDSYYDKGKMSSPERQIEFETHYSLSGEEVIFSFYWIEKDYIFKKSYKNWIYKHKNYVEVYSDWFEDDKKIKKLKTLDEGISELITYDHFLISKIPRLLLPGLGKKIIIDFEHVDFLGEETIDNYPCIHLSAEKNVNSTKIVYHLWLIKNSYLIKQIKRVAEDYEEIILYDRIIVNSDLPSPTLLQDKD